MSATTALASRTWPVGRWTCILTIPRPKVGDALHAYIEWTPALPPGALTASELAQYRTARNAALESIGAELEISVAVVDL